MIRMKQLAWFAICIAFAVGAAQADLITVTNSSFELPDVADGGNGAHNVVDGWYRNVGDDNFHVVDPSTTFTNITADQYLRAVMNPGGLTRTELRSSNTFTFAANTEYTLTVDLTADDRTNRDIDFGFYFYNISSNTTISTYTTNLLDVTPYTFLPGTLELSTIDSPELVGNDFTVTLYAQHNGEHLREVYWDNVQLDAAVIPEPATIGLALAGLFSLRFLRKRRSGNPSA